MSDPVDFFIFIPKTTGATNFEIIAAISSGTLIVASRLRRGMPNRIRRALEPGT